MNKDKWKVIKFKFEQTLKSWEIDKKCNQFTVDSIQSVFPTEIEAIIGYIEELQQGNQQLKEQLQQENARLKEIENKLNFIKNRAKQGMSQENINKCAIELVNGYLKEN